MNRFTVAVVLMPTACCQESACQISREMSGASETEARAKFESLSAKEKVDVFVWEISHSRPAGWKYDYLLVESGRSVSPHPLNAALASDDYVVEATLLRVLSEMDGKELVGLSPDKISEAISRCRNLSEKPDAEVCSRVESELLGKFRSNVSPR